MVSLSIKNLAMGSIFRNDKKTVHQGISEINMFIADIAEQVWPDLAVIDGSEGMEGDGPSSGQAVPLASPSRAPTPSRQIASGARSWVWICTTWDIFIIALIVTWEKITWAGSRCRASVSASV